MEQNQPNLSMEKIRLDGKSLIFYKLLTFLLGAYMFVMLVSAFPLPSESIMEKISFWLLLFFSCYILYGFYLLMQAKKISFDSSSIYLGNNGSEEKIPIESVSTVRWWVAGGRKSLPILSKIMYRNAQDVEKTAMFFVTSYPKMDTLIHAVKEKNPSADVRMRGR